MKVLMFGWEFPPFNSGGLGTACYGLTKGLKNHNQDVTFVLPKSNPDMKADFVNLISADVTKNLTRGSVKGMKRIEIDSPIQGYMTSEEYNNLYEKEYSNSFSKSTLKHNDTKKDNIYGKNLFAEVYRYGQNAGLIAEYEDFDIIHAHDWLTYPAGIAAKQVSGKPLVIHVHATEFDRTGGNVNQHVYDIEKRGMHEADSIIAVSQFTKNKIIENYGINEEKVTVVHNAVEFNDNKFKKEDFKIKEKNKIVLFLGRITIQKGPDWFLYAAKKALEILPNIKFIIAGSGDMERFMIEKSAEMGMADKMLFTGFLRGEDIDKAYQMADLYVMPSISEPFGITPLEAMRNDTPVLISHQSGVSEVINHCLKVNFWDIDEMANKMVSILKHQELHEALKHNGSLEVKKFNWDIPAEKCIQIYEKTIRGGKNS